MPAAEMKALEVEQRFYDSIRNELLRHHEGKFVLIIGEEQLGIFDHAEDAYQCGIEQRGNVPMLIQEIRRDEPIETIPAMVLGLINAHVQ
jgi:hypothetical protein